ncbi:MAG: chromosome partitioning protein ParA, partial [Alphaproteobacteria bacterium]|nr:chromosome partitioning protein ParA [Alphaproteobacteria bacterium]
AAERAQIVEAQGSAAAERDELARRIEVDRADVESRDQAVAHATAAVAAAEAERAQLRRRADEAAQRIARLEGRLADLAGERERLEAEISRAATLELAAAQVAASERAFADARQRQDDIEGRRRAAQEEESGARKALAAAEADLSKLDAEASALSSVLAEGKVEGFRAVLEDLHVDPGYEAALAAALGDDLDAPIDGAAPRHWRADGAGDGAGPALPIGATALADHVRAPAALARRLAQIGVVDDEAGDALAPQLAQGQRLVSRAGALWRWDGFVVRAGTPAAAAARLKQKNRLAELTAQRAPIAAVVEGCRTRLVDSQAALRGAQVDEEQARDASRRMMNELNAARAAAAAEAQAAAARTARRDALIRQDGELTADLAEHRGQAEAVAARFAEIADPAEARAQLEADRRALHDARTVLMELQATMSRLAREGAQREDRLRAIGRDEQAWTQRGESARRQLAVLVERTTQTTAERERIAARPDEIVAERNGLFERIGAAEATRRDAADRLAEAEHETAEAGRALKAIEAELGGAREDRVRTEANRDQAERDGEELTQHIRERLDCAPEETLPLAQADSIDDLPPLAQLQARLERLVKERETVGPVNLRAEEEAEELSKQIEGMRNERDDLTRAIARLRQGISSLNREGRERLLAAFQTVNKHFSELFSKLFGGGRAHLALSAVAPADENGKVDDDPLEAGLEVMASPPGKKLQSLTLLSGGEQALTALALLFAVFQTNPAPICVLDEVDAPLDDANVDRFCTLLDAITRMTDTRFVVVTHHRMTMARMDRLFGVTMGERGVSQLVSVDLAQAARLRATA